MSPEPKSAPAAVAGQLEGACLLVQLELTIGARRWLEALAPMSWLSAATTNLAGSLAMADDVALRLRGCR
jgi:hypothetical protein